MLPFCILQTRLWMKTTAAWVLRETLIPCVRPRVGGVRPAESVSIHRPRVSNKAERCSKTRETCSKTETTRSLQLGEPQHLPNPPEEEQVSFLRTRAISFCFSDIHCCTSITNPRWCQKETDFHTFTPFLVSETDQAELRILEMAEHKYKVRRSHLKRLLKLWS